MLNKILFLSFFFTAILANSQEIEQIRSQYPLAEKSEEITSQLDAELSSITSENNSVLLAYRGAVKTLKAKFAKKVKEKKEYFKEGAELIESAMAMDANNIEIRYIRLTVQENAPKFLKYHDNILEDKQHILKEYSFISSKSLQAIIREFILGSGNFDEGEKQNIGG